jgi:IS5 family transposase
MKTFFDESDKLQRLSELGDSLEKLKAAVDWEMFRPLLNDIFVSYDNRPGGRQRYDRVLMFKILILQKLYSLADDKLEYLINDRLSFQRFLGLTLGDTVPDSKTIWKYREELANSKQAKKLFKIFNKVLEATGTITYSGSIVDATIVSRPRQNRTKEEDEQIKKGEIPENIKSNIHKMRQTDLDARMTKKHNMSYCGYKNHIKADAESKIITEFAVTSAEVHDSKLIAELTDEKDNVIYADSAYMSKKIARELHKKKQGLKLKIIKRGTRGHMLTERQKRANTKKAKIRCRVEHIFGHISKAMGGKFVRCVGLLRAVCEITLKNLAYNMSRMAYLKYKPLPT